MAGKQRAPRRRTSRRTRLKVALAGAGAVSAALVPLSMAAATPAGASGVPAQANASGTSGLSAIVAEVQSVVGNLSLSSLGSYIEGHTQCPVSEVGYILAGVPGPPPCAPGQIGG
jgi:phosphoribosylcarboxyaminoimidazole (NCAIR) mutase